MKIAKKQMQYFAINKQNSFNNIPSFFFKPYVIFVTYGGNFDALNRGGGAEGNLANLTHADGKIILVKYRLDVLALFLDLPRMTIFRNYFGVVLPAVCCLV